MVYDCSIGYICGVHNILCLPLLCTLENNMCDQNTYCFCRALFRHINRFSFCFYIHVFYSTARTHRIPDDGIFCKDVPHNDCLFCFQHRNIYHLYGTRTHVPCSTVCHVAADYILYMYVPHNTRRLSFWRHSADRCSSFQYIRVFRSIPHFFAAFHICQTCMRVPRNTLPSCIRCHMGFDNPCGCSHDSRNTCCGPSCLFRTLFCHMCDPCNAFPCIWVHRTLRFLQVHAPNASSDLVCS